MQIAHTQTHHRAARRATYGLLTALLLTAAITRAVSQGSGWWQFFAFAIGPDLALLAGIGAGLEKGQLHPRAVRLYNVLHSFWGPGLLAIVAAITLPGGYLVGAAAWALHVSLDRTVGYGMRTRDGFQRS
jgi:Domain of unknown function (DUF4260)